MSSVLYAYEPWSDAFVKHRSRVQIPYRGFPVQSFASTRPRMNAVRIAKTLLYLAFAVVAVAVVVFFIAIVMCTSFLPPSPLFYIAILVFLVVAIIRGVMRRQMELKERRTARYLAEHQVCPRCNYDRSGIDAAARCPECSAENRTS